MMRDTSPSEPPGRDPDIGAAIPEIGGPAGWGRFGGPGIPGPMPPNSADRSMPPPVIPPAGCVGSGPAGG